MRVVIKHSSGVKDEVLLLKTSENIDAENHPQGMNSLLVQKKWKF